MSWLSQLLTGLNSLVGALEQDVTNGVSQWGVLPSPNFPAFCGGGPLVNGFPWGNAHPGGSPPNTGVIRKYDWSVTRDIKSPDGFNKSLILVNDQYPGPALEANWGDTFQITVHNNIADEGISMHWHGLTQSKTPWFDGVPGVSQCPIAPASSFTYTFQADQYGTSWWHSHYSGQYGDGLFGPIIIHGPLQPGVSYDYDLGPVMLHDYVHDSYYTSNQKLLAPIPNGPAFPNIDNNLINGKGAFDCSDADGASCTPNAGFAKFNFTTGKTHRLRLISPSTASNQKFSIDNHTFTVIANDFVPVVPYTTDVITLAAGQRTDVLVKATGKPTDAVWMHSEIDIVCAGTTSTNPHGLAAIYYPAANHTSKPAGTTFPSWPSNNCANDPLSKTVPFYPSAPPSTAATTQTINITLGFNASNVIQFFMNGSAFYADYNDPILLDAKNGQSNFPTARNVYDFGSNSSVRLILINTAEANHPMHLHGHNFWVLAEGLGEWDGTVVNPHNPQRRDTQTLQPAANGQSGYLVLEWNQDNPGIWPLHCHLSLHVSGGLYINVMEQKAKIQSDMDIPMVMAQTCNDWQAWTNRDKVDQIDSGV